MINDSKTTDKIERAYNAYTMPNVVAIIKYLHQCFFSPTIPILTADVENGQLQTFPGLTKTAVQKYLNPSPATYKGHMKRPRKVLWSTSLPDKTTRDQLFELREKSEKATMKRGIRENCAQNKQQEKTVPNGHLRAIRDQIESKIDNK